MNAAFFFLGLMHLFLCDKINMRQRHFNVNLINCNIILNLPCYLEKFSFATQIIQSISCVRVKHVHCNWSQHSPSFVSKLYLHFYGLLKSQSEIKYYFIGSQGYDYEIVRS